MITSLYPGYKNQPRKEATWAIHYFANKWVEQGHSVKVVVPWRFYPRIFSFSASSLQKRKYAFEEFFPVQNIEVFRLPMKKIPWVEFAKEIIDCAVNRIVEFLNIKSFKPDIIIAQYSNPSGIIATQLKRKLKIPFIMGLHTSDIFYQKRRPKTFEEIIRNCDGVVFRSKKIKDHFNNLKLANLISKEKIIPSGINKDFIMEKDHILKKSRKETTKIMTACNLIPLKNVDVLIKAFAELDYENLNLTIVGNGKEFQKLKKLSIKKGIEKNIKFAGEMSRYEVLNEMRKSDVFVMVSSPETFGLVYLEAMASGCITVGSKGEGIDGVIKDGYNGFLVEPRNVSALKDTLERIINLNHFEKESILINGLKTVSALSENAVAMQYISFIREIIELEKQDCK
ncbi:hypothetical protein AT15_06455 [Kosmotoga arenicorallina S304]|uniref:Glycosyl transferase family 1 n=1 Tax=Kosmotoga arenicorallina S304 TaxID=1453497 RepID=A0A176JTJ7_9BACT|nr:hypothetical protein AT15_06455 [Kosmotoga arenicorallina S304]